MISDIIWVIIIVGGSFIGIIAIAMGTFIRRHREVKSCDFDDEPQPEPEAIQAEVIFKNMDIQRYGGYKFPRHKMVYFMSFKTQNDEIKKYEVTPQVYERSKLHDKGLLITINGNFFDFGEGEDI